MKKVKSLIILAFILIWLISNQNASAASIKVYVGNEQIKPDIQPILQSGSTLIEARSLFEALGYTMNYDMKTKTVTGIRNSKVIKMVLNNKTATVNGKSVQMAIAPKAINGRTVIPLRFVSESSGATVLWDNKRQEIRVKGIQFVDKDFEANTIMTLNGKTLGLSNIILKEDVRNLEVVYDWDTDPTGPAKYTIRGNDLSDIKYLTGLTELSIQGNATSLEPLSKLTNLTTLYASGNFQSLEQLTNLTKLDYLSIHGDFQSLKGLEKLSNLTHLSISSTKVITDASALKNMPKLSNLQITSVANNQLSNLANLTNLQELKLIGEQLEADRAKIEVILEELKQSNLDRISVQYIQ